MHRATSRRFDTIPACDRRTDGQTDGIAVASTALAMRAWRRAVKTVGGRKKGQRVSAILCSGRSVRDDDDDYDQLRIITLEMGPTRDGPF